MEVKKPIQFFIDTHTPEARKYVYSTVHMHNIDDVDEKYRMRIINVHNEDHFDTAYFTIEGSWDAYSLFLNDAKQYSFSISHYED